MKKILFNDKCGLTAAVLNGTKTQTRRLVPAKVLADFKEREKYCKEICGVNYCDEYGEHTFVMNRSPYKVGEIIAVAQAYKDVNANESYASLAGWSNKLFVKGEDMPHQIRITRVWIERLQDISDEDCMKEGIELYHCIGRRDLYYFCLKFYKSPREVYAALIDKISSKGTWESNPYVYCYEFELVK